MSVYLIFSKAPLFWGMFISSMACVSSPWEQAVTSFLVSLPATTVTGLSLGVLDSSLALNRQRPLVFWKESGIQFRLLSDLLLA